MDKNEVLLAVLDIIKNLTEVQSVGISNGSPAMPDAGDVDVFIFCETIPSIAARQAALAITMDMLDSYSVGVFDDPHYGIGDVAVISGGDVFLMYNLIPDAVSYIEDVLGARRIAREEGGFYPTGRCATFLRMYVHCDKQGFLEGMKRRLAAYPDTLAAALIAHCMRALRGTEDFLRAVDRRDVLFYHYVLEEALDFFLQALFALNGVFFPSRKRSLEYMQNFKRQPALCPERLLEVLKLGGEPDGITRSYQLWRALVDELRQIAEG